MTMEATSGKTTAEPERCADEEGERNGRAQKTGASIELSFENAASKINLTAFCLGVCVCVCVLNATLQRGRENYK